MCKTWKNKGIVLDEIEKVFDRMINIIKIVKTIRNDYKYQNKTTTIESVFGNLVKM